MDPSPDKQSGEEQNMMQREREREEREKEGDSEKDSDRPTERPRKSWKSESEPATLAHVVILRKCPFASLTSLNMRPSISPDVRGTFKAASDGILGHTPSPRQPELLGHTLSFHTLTSHAGGLIALVLQLQLWRPARRGEEQSGGRAVNSNACASQ